MKIDNVQLRRRFARAARCELCLGKNRHGLDPHHFYQKTGSGGGSRLDVSINLTSLCRMCHQIAESGKAVAAVATLLMGVVCLREKCLATDLVLVIDLLWRAPKGASNDWFNVQADAWPESAIDLLSRTLAESGADPEGRHDRG